MDRTELRPEERLRKWAGYAAAWFLQTFHGRDAADAWLWELTPFPAAYPRFSESLFGVVVSFVPWPFFRRVMDVRLRTEYGLMDRAAARMGRPEA